LTRRSTAAPSEGVCRDSRITVRSAALERENDLRGRPRLSFRARGHWQHGFDACDALVDRFSRTAGRLDCHGLEMVAFDHSVFIFHAIDLEDFAAEADHQCGAEIGMCCVAPLGSPQEFPAFAIGRHAAAAAMDECNRAVDFRMIVENSGAVHFLGDEFCDRGRAIHRGQDADIVPRADFPVGPLVAFEGRTQLWRQDLVVLSAFGKTIVAGEIAQRDVMLVHPVTGRDWLRRKTDRLSVLPHRLPFADRRYRHLVATRHALARGNACRGDVGCDLIDGDDDIVFRR
jgi:hypothetical protein